jgi:hypothetical protein
MIYVKFPNPKFDAHPDYVAWQRKKQAGKLAKNEPWQDLYDWLADHTRAIHHPPAYFQPKCWYSEMPLAGKQSKDCEHFRPKKSATPISAKKLNQLDKTYGISSVPQDTALSSLHYPWLALEEAENYTLSSPHVNRTNKNNIFPILIGTARLGMGMLPNSSVEYPLLLSPTRKEDADMLAVSATGDIMPKKPWNATSKPVGFDSDPKRFWGQDWMNGIRIHVSIVVYGLDDRELKDGRRKAYQDALDNIEQLKLAIDAKIPSLVKSLSKTLLERSCIGAPFALAARSACLDYSSSSHATTLVAKYLKKMLANLQQRES